MYKDVIESNSTGRRGRKSNADGMGYERPAYSGGAGRCARGRTSAFFACRSCASPAMAARTCIFSAGVQATALEVLQELVPDTDGHCSLASACRCSTRAALYNTAAVACDGKCWARGEAAPGGRRHPLRAAVVSPLAGGRCAEAWRSAGSEYPLGDLLFECGGVRIGFEICRDAWVADRTGARLAQRGADVLLNPSASHFAFAKQQIRERFVLEGSRAFCVSYAYANLLGNEAGRSIYDGGTLDRLRRQDARARAAVFVCRLAPDDGGDRRRQHAAA